MNIKYDPLKHMEIMDVGGKLYQFTDLRVDRETIPKDMYAYDARSVDEWDNPGWISQIKPFVLVNHFGTVIGSEPIPMNGDEGYIVEDSDDCCFTGDYCNYEEYLNLVKEAENELCEETI